MTTDARGTKRPGRRPSSTDVARLAGVSQSAVSRSFTPGASVSAVTKAKVMRAARALGYQPNALPRMLLTQRSNLVGIVIGELNNPFYPEVLRLLIEELDKQGYRAVVLGLDHHSPTAIDKAIAEAMRYRVDGIVVTSANVSKATAQACARMRTPVVLFNRFLASGGIASIGCDNRAAARGVADLLIADGHRRFGFVSGDPTAPSNRQRHKAFAERLAAAGRGVPRVAGNANTYAAGYAAARNLCAGDDPCDALFCASDAIAFGALDLIRGELELGVPGDVAVVGFDDVPTAAYAAYDLTTVRQRRRRMVARTVEVLDGRVRGDGEAVVEQVPGDLVLRGTTRNFNDDPKSR